MRLAIPPASFTSLLGPSGCGKTTTLRMIAGFEQPTEGDILLAGRPIAGVPPYHRNVNTVFQHYALFPHMDVAQNVGYGLRQRKVGRVEEQHRVEEALTTSDVSVLMRDGVIQQQGVPGELYDRPSNAFVASFIGVSNFIPAHLVEHDRGTARAIVETARGLRLVGHITDPDATIEAGQAVTVAVRPERLRVERSDGDAAPDGGWTAIAGHIRQGTYLGDQTEFRITTDHVGELVARHQNSSGASTGLGPGDSVVIRWHEEANLILAG